MQDLSLGRSGSVQCIRQMCPSLRCIGIPELFEKAAPDRVWRFFMMKFEARWGPIDSYVSTKWRSFPYLLCTSCALIHIVWFHFPWDGPDGATTSQKILRTLSLTWTFWLGTQAEGEIYRGAVENWDPPSEAKRIRWRSGLHIRYTLQHTTHSK